MTGDALYIRPFVNRFLFCVTLVAVVSRLGWGQQVSRAERLTGRDRADKQEMLRIIYSDVRNNYYDPKFHGVDWDAKFAEAQGKIAKAISITEADYASHAIRFPSQTLQSLK